MTDFRIAPNTLSKVHKSLRVGAAKAAHRFTSDYSIQDAERLQAVVVESASCNRDGGLGHAVYMYMYMRVHVRPYALAVRPAP
eukprot:COSAG02_NODE_2186_length_9573_cov_5.783091_3_plen_83_part_00